MNPSGKLPFTWYSRLEDCGAHALGTYPGVWRAGHDIIDEEYREDIYVGYRWSDSHKESKPLFAFGHGLSYTSFQLGKAVSDRQTMKADDKITFTVSVTNTGGKAGSEVVQLYISDLKSSLPRPVKELKGFRKVYLEPGQTKEISITLGRDALSYYDDSIQDWVAEPGQFEALIGTSSEYVKKEKEYSVQACKVLMAVGRRPNTEGLNLEAAGIDYTRKGITVNDCLETSVPGIFAVGDVTGGIMLAHAATFQGLHALNHICGREDGIRFDLIPAAVFTMPEVATVGLTEEQCKERGLQVRCLKSFYRANGKAVSMDEPEGYCKLIAGMDGTVLGAHVMGAHASDLIHEVVTLMNFGGTIEKMKSVIHAHPTLSEILQSVFNA